MKMTSFRVQAKVSDRRLKCDDLVGTGALSSQVSTSHGSTMPTLFGGTAYHLKVTFVPCSHNSGETNHFADSVHLEAAYCEEENEGTWEIMAVRSLSSTHQMVEKL